MSWIGTVPYMLVCGNANTVTVGNNQLTNNDFMGFLDSSIAALISTVTGYGSQGAGPTPVVVYHNWLTGDGSVPAQGTPGSGYAGLSKPFMGAFNFEESSATVAGELSTAAAVCSTARANMISNASNQDTSRRFMAAPSLAQFLLWNNNATQYADWVLLQGQNPLHAGGAAQFKAKIDCLLGDARNASRTVKRMVQVSVTLGDLNATILSALQALTNTPEGISIYAGGAPDNSVQAGTLITLLRAS